MSKKTSKKKIDLKAMFVMILAAGATFAVIFSAMNYFSPKGEPPALCYLANEGFSVSSSGQMVLMDAFYRETFPEDVAMPQALQQSLMDAAPPYDAANLITVSHRHVDHFNAEMLMAHLARNPNAHLILPLEAMEEFMASDGGKTFASQVTAIYPERGAPKTLNINGIDVTVYNLDHRTEVENIGVMFEMGGKIFFHMGDLISGDFAENGIAGLKVDYLLAPYWYFRNEENFQLIKDNIEAAYLVPMHIPIKNMPEEMVERIGSFEDLMATMQNIAPNVLLLYDHGACVQPEE